RLMYIASCTALLPLCGANGLALVPAFALWIAYAALKMKLGARVSIVFATIAVVLAGSYFLGYHRVPFHPSMQPLRKILKMSAQFFAIAFGPGAGGFDLKLKPEPYWTITCVTTVVLFLMTLCMLMQTWWRRPLERVRTAGLMLFLGGMSSLALGLSSGR